MCGHSDLCRCPIILGSTQAWQPGAAVCESKMSVFPVWTGFDGRHFAATKRWKVVSGRMCVSGCFRTSWLPSEAQRPLQQERLSKASPPQNPQRFSNNLGLSLENGNYRAIVSYNAHCDLHGRGSGLLGHARLCVSGEAKSFASWPRCLADRTPSEIQLSDGCSDVQTTRTKVPFSSKTIEQYQQWQ